MTSRNVSDVDPFRLPHRMGWRPVALQTRWEFDLLLPNISIEILSYDRTIPHEEQYVQTRTRRFYLTSCFC